jgi:hypothetical protein
MGEVTVEERVNPAQAKNKSFQAHYSNFGNFQSCVTRLIF